MKKVYVLKNWGCINKTPKPDPYKSPEQQVPSIALVGDIYGHHNFPEGYRIDTSRIVGKTTAGYIKTHSGSFYQLDDIDPEYENMFPNAKERLLQTLPEVE